MRATFLLSIVLMMATLAGPSVVNASTQCLERQSIDRILNADFGQRLRGSHIDGVVSDSIGRMYDIIGVWAIAVAIGDWGGARALGPEVLAGLEKLFADMNQPEFTGEPSTVYARLLVTTTMARVSLVSDDWIPAVRYGRLALKDANRLKVLDPAGSRADFFLGLYEYYTGVAPAWMKMLGSLAGVHGDPVEGTRLLEETIRRNQALAPEAARVLLSEVRDQHREPCRYLKLSEDLVARYPGNYQFYEYFERERSRCAGGQAGIDDFPRLGEGCGDAIANLP